MIIRGALIFVLAILPSRIAFAQNPPVDPVAAARFHFGVLGVAPHLSLANAGVDTNVFNSVSKPERDFTFTLTPSADIWMRTGRGLVTAKGSAGFVYFNRFETERAVQTAASLQYEFRFNRFRPYAIAETLNAKERPGFEIDARTRHYETDFHVGADVRLMSKTTARIELRHLDYRFAGDSVFDGRPLNQELNRSLRVADLSWRQSLTALTTWVTRVSRESERFEFERRRNSDSFRLSSGFELGRFALIRGTAFAGFRKLRPADGGELPEFTGVTADVDVSYTAPTQTRLGVVVQRDLDYSYEIRTPYYVRTGWSGTLTQRVTGRWDGQLSGGRDFLSYQALVASAGRQDSVRRIGAGIGYTLGEEIRASFDVNSFHRSSDRPGRQYRGFRAGFSVTYGY